MRVLLSLVSALAVLGFLGLESSHARRPIRNAFFAVYPAAETSVLGELPSNASHCGQCHFDFDGGGPRNAYGFDLQVAINSGLYASFEEAVLSLELEDSDLDGYNNVTEITDLNFSNTPTFAGLTSGDLGSIINVDPAEVSPHVTPTGASDTIPPTVTVLGPDGGENLTAGTVVPVTWTASDPSNITSVDIFMSDDGGTTYKAIARNEANDGTFDWFVPNRPDLPTLILVEARDGAGNLGSDQSDASFDITGTPPGLVPTTLRDMDLTGTQPLTGIVLDDPDATCVQCHGNYNDAVEPWFNWKGSMMAQAARDPLFLACLAVAEQDAPSVGDLCLRCHTPGGWLEGRSIDTSGGQLTAKDRQGVQCDFCHRIVDPVYQPGVSPPADSLILADLDGVPLAHANGQYVVDMEPVRRGPYADADAAHAFLESPVHRESAVCGTCHDVSNPVYVAGATPRDYVPNTFNAEHPDFDPRNQFPVERTFSEWANSDYANGGVFAPQFAGVKPDGIVSTCQDCHMRDVGGKGSNVGGSPNRSDLALHDLTGGNYFIPDVLPDMWGAEVDAAQLQAGKQRAIDMLQLAASMALAAGQTGPNPTVTVTVTNETGHKLPSGYPEGRRIWLNVQGYDSLGAMVYESGGYDVSTGVLTHDSDLKTYEIKPGISSDLSPIVNLPVGPSFHFVLNDTIFKDNRIPPRGFTNAAYEVIQSPVIAHTYPDGQHWDETLYALPTEARKAVVTLYYQVVSKEYVEFLRDENHTNTAGDDFYALWEKYGKAAPIAMAVDSVTLNVTPTSIGDIPHARTALLQGAPNPFRGTTTIGYELESRAPVSIRIYDVQGKLVRTLVDDTRPPGKQTIVWDGRNHYGQTVASGIYYYQMRTPTFEATRKVVRLR